MARVGWMDYRKRDHITALGDPRFICRYFTGSKTLCNQRNSVGNRNDAIYSALVI